MGLQLSGIVFMALAFSFIGGLMFFCCYQLLFKKAKK